MFDLTEWLHAKIVEPKQRNKDGMRWIFHRFPIKGGISPIDVMAAHMMKTNALLQRINNLEARNLGH